MGKNMVVNIFKKSEYPNKLEIQLEKELQITILNLFLVTLEISNELLSTMRYIQELSKKRETKLKKELRMTVLTLLITLSASSKKR